LVFLLLKVIFSPLFIPLIFLRSSKLGYDTILPNLTFFVKNNIVHITYFDTLYALFGEEPGILRFLLCQLPFVA